jgi:probable DNA repair protein
VPSRQRLAAVRLAHAAEEIAAGRRAWSTADVQTPAGWVRRECERRAEAAPTEWPRVLSPAEEWLLWRHAAHEAARDHPFLDTDTLAESLQRSSERAAEYGVRLAADAPDSEAEFLYQAQCTFEARCRETFAASVSALAPRLREAREGHAVLLRGFDTLSPALAALAGAPAAVRPSEGGGAPAQAAARLRGVRTEDAPSQLEAIATWCCERLREQPDARLLVMLPGPAGARERLAALISAALDPRAALSDLGDRRALVGIEGGEPFGLLPLPSQGLLSLALLAGGTFESDSVCRWLTSDYWGVPPPAARAALALLLRQGGAASLDVRELVGALQLAPPELRPAARELAAQVQRGAALLGEGSASPRRWSERFEAALAALGWPGKLPALSAVQQTRLRWRELLEEFGELAASVGNLTRDAALELLRALALRTHYRPADEGAPVTLSPSLADPVVIYDGIWVGSLSADVLPQPVAPSPFLPLRAQIEAGVPEASAAGRRSQAQTLLAAWRESTRELVLSVPARERDLELLPSPYLSGLTLERQEPRSLWLPGRLHRDGYTEAIVDERGSTFNPLTPLPSGTRALTLQNACAFRAYAELRLGAAPKDEAEPGVPMDQRGLLLHAALQALWERLRDSAALGALDERALEALIGECVAQAARTLQSEVRGRRRRARRAAEGQFDLFTTLTPALTRECRRAERLIRRLCELERTRAPFRVEATEHSTELALGGGRVRLRLDRVDALEGGRAVLDYKSGRPGSPDWFGERPTHPQLLAYTAALGADVVALATVNLTAREVRFTGVAATNGLLPKVKALPRAGRGATPEASGLGAAQEAAGQAWAAQQRSWEALIERLIRAFLAGDARVDPAPGACDYCHVTDICRIGAQERPEVPAHADDTDE